MGEGLKIVVLVKQVPDAAEVKIDPKTGSLVREGVDGILNPDDRSGLDAAFLLKQKHGGKIIAVTMGPPQAVDVLTEALGLGADQGILLTDRFFAGADTWATSYTLGLCLEKLRPFDLVIAGRQAVDGDTAQVGPQLAEGLGLPQVTCVQSLDVAGGILTAERLQDEGLEKVEVPLPVLVTVSSGQGEPRYPVIPDLLAACRPSADIKVLNAADIGARADMTGLAGSYTRVIRTFSPKSEREGRSIEGTPEEMARILMSELRSRHLV